VDVGVINQAHDGYLELFLHVGLPMTFAAVLGFAAALFRIAGRAVTGRSAGVQAAYAMMAMLLFLNLLHNFTEASLLMRGAPFCSVVLLMCFVGARGRPAGEILS
jgi:O-antigen ligase